MCFLVKQAGLKGQLVLRNYSDLGESGHKDKIIFLIFKKSKIKIQKPVMKNKDKKVTEVLLLNNLLICSKIFSNYN